MRAILYLLICLFTFSISQSQTIINIGNTFSPDTLIVNVGDTITFNLGGSHNAVEVDQTTWMSNGTASNGGFNITNQGGGSGTTIPMMAQTYYYVCQPHVTMGMKGVIIANSIPGCTDSIAINYNPFATVDDGSCIYCQNTTIDSINSSIACAGDTLIIYGSNLCSPMSVNLQGWPIPDSLILSSTSDEVVWILPSTSFSISVVNLRYIDANNISSYTNILNLSNGIEGCIDTSATNYNSLATCDDGSCTYTSLGNLFISEYAEGAGYNKYIEIYNGTGAVVDLSDYDIWKIQNGGTWPEFSLSLTGTLANSEVYIICSSNSNVSPVITSVSDTVWGGANWNGNDAVGLAKNGVLIDAVGNGVDPGVAWDVAGIVGATKEHTLVRKCHITNGDTNWIVSAGVDSLTSQWIVYPQNYWVDINQHSGLCACANNVCGCTDLFACNYDSLANTDDGSCAYDVIWQQSELICNGDSVVVGSSIYYVSGTYTDTLSTIYGCDSTVYTTIIVNNPTDFQQSLTLCEGDSIVVGVNVYHNPGNYSDTLTSVTGCDSIVFSNLDFYPALSLFIQTSPNPAEICIGDTILLEGSSGFSYYWWNSGSTGSSLTDDPIVDTWYLLSAKDSNDCIVKEDVWVYVDSCITSINDLSLIKEIQLYPNPVSEELIVDFTMKATTLKVYNMLGKLVFEKKILEGQYRLDIDVKEWRSAIYSMQLYNKDVVVAHKVFNVAR